MKWIYRIIWFFDLVWCPWDDGYRISIKTAWDVACILEP